MLKQIMEEFGEQILAAIEILLIIGLLAALFFGGTAGKIFYEIADAMG